MTTYLKYLKYFVTFNRRIFHWYPSITHVVLFHRTHGYILMQNSPGNISTLFQRCLLVDTTSWRGATSNQRWNNFVYVNVGIFNIERLWINVVYFNVDINNVETTFLFSTLLWTTLVKVEAKLWKWLFLKKTKQIIPNRICGIRSFNYYFIIFLTLFPMLSWTCRRILARPRKFFKYYERYCIART